VYFPTTLFFPAGCPEAASRGRHPLLDDEDGLRGRGELAKEALRKRERGDVQGRGKTVLARGRREVGEFSS
jgi:hypothetical protein